MVGCLPRAGFSGRVPPETFSFGGTLDVPVQYFISNACVFGVPRLIQGDGLICFPSVVQWDTADCAPEAAAHSDPLLHKRRRSLAVHGRALRFAPASSFPGRALARLRASLRGGAQALVRQALPLQPAKAQNTISPLPPACPGTSRLFFPRTNFLLVRQALPLQPVKAQSTRLPPAPSMPGH